MLFGTSHRAVSRCDFASFEIRVFSARIGSFRISAHESQLEAYILPRKLKFGFQNQNDQCNRTINFEETARGEIELQSAIDRPIVMRLLNRTTHCG